MTEVYYFFTNIYSPEGKVDHRSNMANNRESEISNRFPQDKRIGPQYETESGLSPLNPESLSQSPVRTTDRDAALSKLRETLDLPAIRDLLKKDRFGYHEVTNEDLLEEEELEYFDKSMNITGVHPILVDRSGEVFWVIDSRGFMFKWNRVEYCMFFMGHNIMEGITRCIEDPESMLVWVEYREKWIEDREITRLADEMIKREMAKPPTLIILPEKFRSKRQRMKYQRYLKSMGLEMKRGETVYYIGEKE